MTITPPTYSEPKPDSTINPLSSSPSGDAIVPMPPPNPIHLLTSIILLSFISPISSSPLSTIALSHVRNVTLVCALIPSSGSLSYELNCTSFPGGRTRHYPAGLVPYSAIAAGDGFLCALTSPPSSNLSTMRWWDFAHNPHNNSIPDAKRVYIGPSISSLSAGDSHVCGLTDSSGGVSCWRWPQLAVPAGLKPSELAVGGRFVCGLLSGGSVRCFGSDDGVVGNEPAGTFKAVAAGTSHACAISADGRLVCWGFGAPAINDDDGLPAIDSMALGNNRTCALDDNAMLHCWGEDLPLADDLAKDPFVAIQARGDAFCGVLMSNYSLVCWGSEAFAHNRVVFKQVLPGVCAVSCPCLPLGDTGNLCGDGSAVCGPCRASKSGPGPGPSPNSTIPTPVVQDKGGGTGNATRRLIFIIVGSVGFVIGLIAVACFLFYKFRQKGRIHDAGGLRRPPTVRPMSETATDNRMTQLHNTTVEEFPIKFLLSITDGFSDEHKIGSGSFGSVYRATLADGRVIAIKRAESSASTSAQRARTPPKESAFCSELGLLSRVNHKNLVRLFGYCKHGQERILVYEFVTNGTLHDLLHKSEQRPGSPLGSWAARIRVALDAARGIEYLHTYAVPPIIHRDIKSSNILLDDQWTATVSDFGLSLMNPSTFAVAAADEGSLSAAGTVGYMDPEYYRLRRLTAKSDVYSFGVVMLEMLSGCRVIQRYEESGTPKNVVEFAVPHIVADDIHRVLDGRLVPPTPSEIEAVAYMGYLAADCVNPEGRDRPTMTEIVNGLERALAAISSPSSASRSSTSAG